MLTNPDTIAALRVQLTLVVVAVLLFIAQLGNDDDPPNAPEPIAAYAPWPVTEQTYETFPMYVSTPEEQLELFPEDLTFDGQEQEDYSFMDAYDRDLLDAMLGEGGTGFCIHRERKAWDGVDV
jgi:hypothetical protein